MTAPLSAHHDAATHAAPRPELRAVSSSPAPSDAELDTRFADVLAEVAAGAAARERRRALALEEVTALRRTGFTRMRLPVEHGGLGAGFAQAVRQWERLGEADPNLVQALRAHFSFTETVLAAPPGAYRDRWLPRLAAGQVVGNATTERGNPAGGYLTELREDGRRLVLEGRKYYGTGSLYADWVVVAAADRRPGAEPGALTRVAVPADAPGLELVDDWDGFGQRLTASGTTVLRGVEVDPADVQPWRGDDAPSTSPALVQVILLSALSGIARAVRRDAVAYVTGRARSFDHANHAVPARDPQVQEVVGRLSAASFAVSAVLAATADELGRALELGAAGHLDASTTSALDTSVAEAQVFIVDTVLAEATRLFEVGGASAVGTGLALDRHWRNARVLGQHNPVVFRARSVGQQRLTGDARFTSVTVGTRPIPQENR